MTELTASNHKLGTKAILWILALLLPTSLILSVTLGRYPIHLKELMGILASQFVEIESFWTPIQESLLLEHRLPRILLSMMVGCCLASSGAVFQGVFQNPMAAPDLLGASSGAAFGAALAILLGRSSIEITLFAFTFSLFTVFTVMMIGNRTKGKRAMGMILSGIMVTSFINSATSYIKLVADPEDQLPAITYWLMGSFNGTSPKDLIFAFLPMCIGLLPLYLLRWRLNLLTLQDEEARTMGISTKKLRMIVIICSTLLTAASVAVSGTIGFVGLIVPHLSRRLVGNNYTVLLPCSMMFGSVFLLMVDNLSRNLMSTEIPIGILTSFLGAPFFLYLISRGGERF